MPGLARADAIYAYSFILTNLDVSSPANAAAVAHWYRHRPDTRLRGLTSRLSAAGRGRWWLAGWVLLKIVYLLMRWLLGLTVLVFRGDQARDAELLVLRHENAVLRRHADRVRYEPGDRAWFAALARFIPRRCWAEVFPVTPATLLAWHRKLAARKYDTSKRRKPGRPPTTRSIAGMAVRLAKENPLWGTAGSTVN